MIDNLRIEYNRKCLLKRKENSHRCMFTKHNSKITHHNIINKEIIFPFARVRVSTCVRESFSEALLTKKTILCYTLVRILYEYFWMLFKKTIIARLRYYAYHKNDDLLM